MCGSDSDIHTFSKLETTIEILLLEKDNDHKNHQQFLAAKTQPLETNFLQARFVTAALTCKR